MTEEQGTGTLHNHMLAWLHNFKSASELKSLIQDEEFKDRLLKYLEEIIKQSYLDTDSIDEDLDVSEVSCKHPVNPDGFKGNPDGFKEKLNEDVNQLVKVANTHSCRSTCYKYRKDKVCRFGYPREIVEESKVTDENIILLKRLSEKINNYNPYVMTCIRSNHDIKFVPSGKDGYNIAFYVSEYAIKAQISTQQIIPLISVSKKNVDVAYASDNCSMRTRMLINKCLNRILTETEVSAAHVSHFLLGHSDKKSSHEFTRLNMHNALGWLNNQMKNWEHNLDDAIPLTDKDNDGNVIKNIMDNLIENVIDNLDQDDNDNDDDNNYDDDTSKDMYSISKGNSGLVLVNNMTDYINRGKGLKDICLYEYCSKVRKTTFTDDEKKKYLKEKKRIEDEKNNPKMFRKTGRKPPDIYFFSPEHPQSETHWQILRSNGYVPALSKLPSNPNTKKEIFQKCILLLFKPFTCLEDLYNNYCWDDSYKTFYDSTSTKFTDYIDNIKEMHIGLDEREQNRDDEENVEITADTVDSSDELDDDDPIESNEKDLDSQTIKALDIIKSTTWLDESISNQQTVQLDDRRPLIRTDIWQNEMKKQNEDILNNVETDECEIEQHIPTPDELMSRQNDDLDVGFSVESSDDYDLDLIAGVIADVQFKLNKKQKVAFNKAISNVIKRERKEETEQIIMYVGGAGGTGKSQVIKAIVAFHKEIKAKRKVKLTANTGTAAKHIGGSTTTSLFNFRRGNTTKLQKKFEEVDTVIVDEVSMIGCYQLANMSSKLNLAKPGTDASKPFGGLDMIFFGDFMQFPPIKDSPLYHGWNKETNKTGKMTEYHIRSQIGMNMWKNLSHVILLDQQMRVTDKAYQELLNRLREGKCTDSDVRTLNSRIVGQTVDITLMSGNPIITPGNELGMEINKLFAHRHSLHQNVFVTRANDSMTNGKISRDVFDKYKDKPHTQTGQIPREIPMFVGMPVYVSKNLKVELGLTNGTSGKIKSIHLKNAEKITENTGIHYVDFTDEDCIIVELDDVNVKPLRGLKRNHIPITKVSTSFQVTTGKKDRNGKPKRGNVNRTHFPIVPRFSITAHKSQGMTLDKAIVDLVPHFKKPVEINFAYVPLSRVRRLEDLTILRPFPVEVLKAKVNEGCAAMMEEFKSRDLCRNL